MELEGKVACITGGASGIGRAVAVAFAGQGCDIVVADVDDEGGGATAAEVAALGRRCEYIRTDVRVEQEVRELARRAISQMGSVDILMNNAGVFVHGPLDHVSMDDWRWVTDTNLFGVIHGVHAFLDHMLERGSGHIVNTASLAGLFAHSPMAIPYIATKHAVVGLSEGLALYLRPRGIGVSVLCPGIVRTNLARTARFVGDARPTVADARAQGRRPVVLEPGEVAAIVVDGIRQQRFLLLTQPEHRVMLARRSEDLDAALDAQIEQLAGREGV